MTEKTWRQKLASNDMLNMNAGVVREVIEHAESKAFCVNDLEECSAENEKLKQRVLELELTNRLLSSY